MIAMVDFFDLEAYSFYLQEHFTFLNAGLQMNKFIYICITALMNTQENVYTIEYH